MTHKTNSIHNTLRYILYIGLFIPPALFAGTVISVPSTGIATIANAMLKARAGDTILVDNGTYREYVFIKSGVTLKARNLHKAILNGKGRGTVVTMGSNSSINGFVVKNGTIGIFTKNSGNAISRCLIKNNCQTGIITVRHCPMVEDNIIVYNRASGIQGWNVRAFNSSINHNTIAYNRNHGISFGGTSDIVFENNVVAFNERFAMKLSTESEKSKIVHNNFYKNLRQMKKMPSENYNFNPAFISPRVKLNFQSDSKLCCQIKSDNNENLGARIR